MWGAPRARRARRDPEGRARLAPSIYTAGEIIDGDPPIWPGSIAVRDAAEATAEVERQHARRLRLHQGLRGLTPEAYDAIIAAAGKYRMPVIGHVPPPSGSTPP